MQNNFYWGVLIPTFQDLFRKDWGEIKSVETHEILKFQCNYFEKVNENTGEVLRVPKSTTELTTSGFMDFHQNLRQLALDFLTRFCPNPTNS